MAMNIFLWQNFGRGVAFKTLYLGRVKADSSGTYHIYRWGIMEVRKGCFLWRITICGMLEAT